MRLSTLAKTVGAVALVALAGGAAFGAYGTVRELLSAAPIEDRQNLAATTRTLVYGVPQDGAIRFALSRPTTLVRVLSQPNIAPASWGTARAWIYGYRVVLRGADGSIVLSRDIYSRALHPDRLRPYKRPVRFRRNSDAEIALQDEAVLETVRPVSTVELTALDADEGVIGLDARVFERLPFIGNTALSAYRRRAPGEQAQLARADAFGPDLLSNKERAAVMANRWRVVGPVGIAGEDYTVSVVYERPFRPASAAEPGG